MEQEKSQEREQLKLEKIEKQEAIMKWINEVNNNWICEGSENIAS